MFERNLTRQIIFQKENFYNNRDMKEVIYKTVYMFKDTKFFKVHEHILKTLLLTDNNIGRKKLPFNSMFINNWIPLTQLNLKLKTKKTNEKQIINLMDYGVSGIHLVNSNSMKFGDEHGITKHYGDVAILWFIEHKTDKDKFLGNNRLLTMENTNFFFDNKVFTGEMLDNIGMKHLLPKITSQIALLVCNILDFLNEPDVRYVVSEHKSLNKKRLKHNKKTIYPTLTVQITGETKQYFDALRMGRHFSYSHKFWVRGHYKHYTHPRYKNMQGKRTWVKPFIKGEGLLLNKKYNLKKGDKK